MSLSHVRRSAIGRTAGYYGAMATFGLLGAAWGPALPFLASSTNTDLARVSLIFTSLALGGFLGTTLGGRSYDRIPGHAIMTVALLVMAGAAVLIPLTATFWLLLLLIFVLGAAAGLMTVGANTLLVWIHPDNVGPWITGLHFFSGIGAVLAPLIIVFVMSALTLIVLSVTGLVPQADPDVEVWRKQLGDPRQELSRYFATELRRIEARKHEPTPAVDRKAARWRWTNTGQKNASDRSACRRRRGTCGRSTPRQLLRWACRSSSNPQRSGLPSG